MLATFTMDVAIVKAGVIHTNDQRRVMRDPV